MALTTIISGGQTGADQGGLAAGVALGLRTGGWIPKGWKTEKGPMPELGRLPSGGLKEHASSDYPPRTKANAVASDGTLLFGDKSSRGSIRTRKEAERAGKPLLVVPWKAGQPIPSGSKFRKWLSSNHIQVLNVAGNRESGQRGIFDATRDFIVQALRGARSNPKAATTKKIKPLAFSMMPIQIVDMPDGSRKVIATKTGQEKSLTTRKAPFDKRTKQYKANKTGLKVGEVGVMQLKGKPLAVKYLGRKTYKETLALFGGMAGYGKAEGFPPGGTLNAQTKASYFGTALAKKVDLFALSATPAKSAPKKAKTTKKKAATKSASTRTPREPRQPRPEKKGRKAVRRSPEGTDWGWAGDKELYNRSKYGNVLEVYPVNPLGAAWADAALRTEGEERAAVEGVGFGLLSRLDSASVLQFVRNIKQSGRGAFYFPMEILSSADNADEALITEALLAVGPEDDKWGAAISPFEPDQLQALIVLLLASKVWSVARNDWAGHVVFRVPQEVVESHKMDGLDVEVETVQAQQFVSYLCGEEEDNCPSSRFLRGLHTAAIDLHKSLSYDLWLTKGQRERSGFPPLTHGLVQLRAQLKLVGIASFDEMREALREMSKRTSADPASKLANLMIGFYDKEGKSRTYSEKGYYGDNTRMERRIASKRRAARATLTEAYLTKEQRGADPYKPLSRLIEEELKSFDELRELAVERGDQEQIDFIDFIEKGNEDHIGLSFSQYAEQEDKTVLAAETGQFKRSKDRVGKKLERRAKPVPAVLPLTLKSLPEELGGVKKIPTLGVAFTLYWCDTEDIVVLADQQVDLSKPIPYKIVGRAFFTQEEADRKIEAVRRNMTFGPDGSYSGTMQRHAAAVEVRATEAAQGRDIAFNPASALRMHALQAMGVQELAGSWYQEEAAPLAPILIATAIVDLKSAAAWGKFKAPYTLPASAVIHPSSRREQGVGVYFSQIELAVDKRTNLLTPTAWKSPWEMASTPKGLVVGSISGKTGAISSTVAKSQGATMVADLAGFRIQPNGNAIQREPAPDLFSFDNVQHTQSYEWWSGNKDSPLLDEEIPKEDIPAMAYLRVISSRTSGWTRSRGDIEGGVAGVIEYQGRKVGVGKKKSRKDKEVTKSSSKKSIFRFAATICKLEQVNCSLEATAARVTNADINALMEDLSIEGGADNKEALQALQAYFQALIGGNFYEGQHAADLGRLGRGREFIDELAKPNRSRRGRRPPRRPRRGRRSERNPLSESAEQLAVAYAQRGAGKGDDRKKELQEALNLSLERENVAPADWEISSAGLQSLFPRQGDPNAWGVERRFDKLKDYNLVSRVGPLPTDYSRQLHDDLQGGVLPVGTVAFQKRVEDEAGLSVEEAAKILSAQRQRRSSKYTMQPSSAICKNQRTRKVKDYYLPHAFTSLEEVDESRDLMIWLSPHKGSKESGPPAHVTFSPRVMSWRRGVHIDCDMVGEEISEVPALFAHALQSALYWLAEKPKRKAGTRIWVGRVGERVFYNAWKPGDPLTLAQVMANLKERQDAFGDAEVQDNDIRYYMRALRASGREREIKG